MVFFFLCFLLHRMLLQYHCTVLYCQNRNLFLMVRSCTGTARRCVSRTSPPTLRSRRSSRTVSASRTDTPPSRRRGPIRSTPTSSPRSLSSTTTAKAGSCPTCRCNFSEPFRQAERNRARSNCRGEKWTKEIQPFRQAGCRAELVRAVPRREMEHENKPNLKP